MGVEQGQIGKTEEMADLNKNQDPGVDSLSAARPYRPLSLRARLILLLFVIAIPLTGMALGFQKMIASYSASYDAILANLKTANEYNIKFKSDIPCYDRADRRGTVRKWRYCRRRDKVCDGGQESPQPDCVGETGVRNDDRAGTGVGL